MFCFLALPTGTELELDDLALGQGRATGLKVGDVHEHVVASLPGDETEPTLGIEKLYCALHHETNFFTIRDRATTRSPATVLG